MSYSTLIHTKWAPAIQLVTWPPKRAAKLESARLASDEVAAFPGSGMVGGPCKPNKHNLYNGKSYEQVFFLNTKAIIIEGCLRQSLRFAYVSTVWAYDAQIPYLYLRRNVRFRFNVVCFTYATIGELVLNFWDLGKQTSRQHDSKLFSVRMRRSLKMNLNYHCCCYHLVDGKNSLKSTWEVQIENTWASGHKKHFRLRDSYGEPTLCLRYKEPQHPRTPHEGGRLGLAIGLQISGVWGH